MFKKLLIYTVLLIFIALVLSLSFKSLGGDVDNNKDLIVEESGKVIHSVALFADSHTSYDNLKSAVDMAKNRNVDFIIHTGDLSDFGETESYIKSKNILDESGIEYAVLPGDRDMVENGINFSKYFNDKLCSTKSFKNTTITCLNNPYNYTLLTQEYIDMFNQSIIFSDIVIASQPIYNPRSNIYMGYYDNKVKEQADTLFKKLLDSNVKTVISGDAHFFSSYSGPAESQINFYTLGALSSERNIESPNFAIIQIYDTGKVTVNQVLLD